MIAPEKVAEAAGEKEEENLRFRAYLKQHADEDELDRLFSSLHRTLFDSYDCAQCRNCCKLMSPCIYEFDIPAIAAHLSMSQEELKDTYLMQESIIAWSTKHVPCDFLAKSGECLLGKSKPAGCAEFPYTDKPERLESLYSVLTAAEVCPVAFEIIEQLKRTYGFC